MAKGQHHQLGTGGLLSPVLGSSPESKHNRNILPIEWSFWPTSSPLLEEILSPWCDWARELTLEEFMAKCGKGYKRETGFFSGIISCAPIRMKGGGNQMGPSSFFPFSETRFHYRFHAAFELIVASNSKLPQLHKSWNYTYVTALPGSLLFYTRMPTSWSGL